MLYFKQCNQDYHFVECVRLKLLNGLLNPSRDNVKVLEHFTLSESSSCTEHELHVHNNCM